MKKSLDLLSKKSHQRNQFRKCLRIWTGILVGTLVCCSVVGLFKWYSCQQLATAQASAEAEYEPIRQLNLENARLKKQIEELEKAEIIPLKLAVHEPLLALVGTATTAVSQQQERVYLQEFAIERAPLSLEDSGASLTTVLLEGFSEDMNSVEQLSDAMRKLDPFVEVDLTTQNIAVSDSQQQVGFTIECANRFSED